jgi:hypothetical protein
MTRTAVVTALTICCSPVVAAAAGQRVPIGLDCAIESQSLLGLYGEEGAKTAATAWCTRLAQRFADRTLHPELSPWRYETPGGENKSRLKVAVADGAPGETLVTLRFLVGVEELAKLERKWRKPGDAFPDPALEDVPEVFEREVVSLLEENASVLHDQLKLVPLAIARWRDPAQRGRIVAALPWVESSHLRCSTFRVACLGSDSNLRTLECRANARPEPFPATESEPEYQALSVETVSPEDQEDEQLEPKLLFLQSYAKEATCGFDIFL